MVTCAVKDCPNNLRNAYRRARFFRFPSEHRRRKLWTEFCERQTPWIPNHNSRICSDHFDEYQYEIHRQDGLKKLSPVAIPTVHSKQVNVCNDRIKANIIKKKIIEEEKDSFEPRCKIVSCDEFMYHQLVVWLDHDYCKVWSENTETDEVEPIFVKNEPEWLPTEIKLETEDFTESQQLIETLGTVIKREY